MYGAQGHGDEDGDGIASAELFDFNAVIESDVVVILIFTLQNGRILLQVSAATVCVTRVIYGLSL